MTASEKTALLLMDEAQYTVTDPSLLTFILNLIQYLISQKYVHSEMNDY